MPSKDVDDSKVVKDVHAASKTANIIEDISVGSNILIVVEGHASYEGTIGLKAYHITFDDD